MILRFRSLSKPDMIDSTITIAADAKNSPVMLIDVKMVSRRTSSVT